MVKQEAKISWVPSIGSVCILISVLVYDTLQWEAPLLAMGSTIACNGAMAKGNDCVTW